MPKTTTTKYDMSLLQWKIRTKYKNMADFCKAAGVDYYDFKDELTKSDLSAEHIEKAAKALDILPAEIGLYFFTPTPDGRGRPTKEITKTTTPPENNRYYTITEASELLHVHRHTLQARLRAGTLKGKLIGRTWRIYKDELFDNSDYYYYFDCEDGVFGERYMTPAEINQLHTGNAATIHESQIIAIAKNLEAVLFRYERREKDFQATYTNGVCIYDCMI